MENIIFNLLESQELTNTILGIMFIYIYELKKNLKRIFQFTDEEVDYVNIIPNSVDSKIFAKIESSSHQRNRKA